MVKYYTGIGSRATPLDVLALMTRLARYLRYAGFTLRSGRAAGADEAFEKGAGDQAVVYLPWPLFRKGPWKGDPGYSGAGGKELAISEREAEQNWWYLQDLGIMTVHPTEVRPAAVKLHGRNVWQVIGHEPEVEIMNSEFVIFWAPERDGVVEGGTRTAVYLARKLRIPTFNLYHPAIRAKFEARLEGTGF